MFVFDVPIKSNEIQKLRLQVRFEVRAQPQNSLAKHRRPAVKRSSIPQSLLSPTA
jgi:hypothetical protein